MGWWWGEGGGRLMVQIRKENLSDLVQQNFIYIEFFVYKFD